MNLVEPFRRIARQKPSLPALLVDGRTISYGELLADVAGLAAWFDADGVRAGQRVAVYGSPVLRVVSTLALGWLGAVSTDTSGVPDSQLGELADAFGLDVIYSKRDLGPLRIKARVSKIGSALAGFAAPQPPPLRDCDPDALWRIVVSSGTTGRPKGIACSYASVLNVHLIRTVYPCGPGDVVVIAMNPAMSFAVHNWLRCLYAGACAHLAESIRAPELLALLQGDQPTHCMVTPAMANNLAAICSAPDAPVPGAGKRLHTFSVGGGRVSAGVREAVGKYICANVYGHYGAAEAQMVAVLDSDLYQTNPGCSGRLLPWVEVQAIGEAGEVLPPGEAGPLRIRSPVLATGYIGAADSDAFRDGWFQSQDRGVVGSKGLLFIQGRTNDVINLAGRKLDPEMVEEAILEDQGILECAVVDVPGPDGQELVAVIVNPSGDADTAALIERSGKAAPGVRVRRVVRSPKLPRNDNGKIMRDAVRQVVAQTLKGRGDGS